MKIRSRIFQLGLLPALLGSAIPASAQGPDRGTRVATEVRDLGLGAFRALIIGIDGYESWPTLRFAESDASDIESILVDLYEFEPKNVVKLLGSDATESNILSRLRETLAGADGKDNVLIYFAGHGQFDSLTETGFWIPVDGKLADQSTWIPFTTVTTMLTASGVQARSVVAITDSCYGGALSATTRSGPTRGGPGNPHYPEGLRVLASRRSRQVIASGGFQEVPDESEFARLLKSALRDNDHSVVDLEFLFFSRIYEDLRSKGQQTPIMARLKSGRDEGGQFLLVRRGGGENGNAVVDREQTSPPDEITRRTDLAFWTSIQESDDRELFEDYLRRFPKGVFAAVARKKLIELELTAVPTVFGLDLGQARRALSDAGLGTGTTKQAWSGRPEGTVISESPPAGTKLSRGASVDLVLADWPALPDFTGLDESEAQAACRNLGMDLTETRYVDSSMALGRQGDFRPGMVVAQRPDPLTKLAPGSRVELTVFGTLVPNLLGLDGRTAEVLLETRGLTIRKSGTAAGAGRVVVQTPAPGQVVAPGSAVDLAIEATGTVAVLLPAPRLLYPKNGEVLLHFPRNTTLVWESLRGAVAYGVEVELGSNGAWAPLGRETVRDTRFALSLPGAGRCRWRVWAIGETGLEGPKSIWWEFE